MGNCSNEVNNENAEIDNLRMHRNLKYTFNPFFEQNIEQNNQQHILNQYKFHSHYDDKFIGKCSILQQKETNNLYLCKNIIYSNQEKYHQQLQIFKNKKEKLISENIIRIKQVLCKNNQGFLFDQKKIIIISQYPLIDVRRELNNRIIKKLTFSKDQIMNFIISTIKGYSNIEQAKYKNNKIRLSNIFFGLYNKISYIKVTQNKYCIDEKSNFENIVSYGTNNLSNRDIYLAPQEFQAYIKNQQQPNSSKAGVFSLGLCILDLCVMNESIEVYDYDHKEINNREIKCRIEISGQKYGGIIQRFLKDMLCIDQNKRLSFTQLENYIPSILNEKNQLTSKMHLSIIKSQKSQYLNNSKFNPKKSQMQRSLTNSRVSVVEPGSRIFVSGIGLIAKQQQQDLETIHQKYTNGNQYIGQKSIKNKYKQGKGKYIFKDGSYYQGSWEQNRIEGKGTLYFNTGKIQYTGQWKQDQYDGWGTLNQLKNLQSSWLRYQGQFKHGVRQGRGKMFFKDNSIYDGQFRGDKIYGRGRKISRNGEIIDKIWQLINPEVFIDLY